MYRVEYKASFETNLLGDVEKKLGEFRSQLRMAGVPFTETIYTSDGKIAASREERQTKTKETPSSSG